jgi:uncharacterized protein YbaA (DUF1428 family)
MSMPLSPRHLRDGSNNSDLTVENPPGLGVPGKLHEDEVDRIEQRAGGGDKTNGDNENRQAIGTVFFSMWSRMFARRLVSLAAVSAIVLGCRGIARAQSPIAPVDYSQEAVVVEESRTLLKFDDDGTGRREVYMRVRTQSEAGVQQFGQLVFGYNSANERAEIAFVRVHKPDGIVVATPSDSVQDLSSPVQRIAPVYTDFRQKHVTVQGLRPGDILEFSVVTSIHVALAPGQFWSEYTFEQNVVVLDEELDIDVPAGRMVAFKLRPGFEAMPEDHDGRRVYRWARSQLKTISDTKVATLTATESLMRVLPVTPSWPMFG